jgi:hypothetical protein
MTDRLQDLLQQLLNSRTTPNPAFNQLIDDYVREHAVTAIITGVFFLASTVMAARLTSRFFRTRRLRLGPDGSRYKLEKRVCGVLAAAGLVSAAFFGIVAAANIQTARDPRPGFGGVVQMIGRPAQGTPTALRHRSFQEWVESGSPEMPKEIQQRIDARLNWQLPKAVISTLLLPFAACLSRRTWLTLIDRSHTEVPIGRLRHRLGLASGTGLSATTMVLMLMVIGNTAAVLAPLGLTLTFG